MCGDKTLKLNVFCPQNGTGVLKGLSWDSASNGYEQTRVGEYISKEFKKLCVVSGITMEALLRSTPKR